MHECTLAKNKTKWKHKNKQTKNSKPTNKQTKPQTNHKFPKADRDIAEDEKITKWVNTQLLA